MAEAHDEDPAPRTSIDWQATLAGAAAAVTVAVLLSTLGAAGTLIGAALGSVIASVSSALYKQGIESSRRRMADVQATALNKINLADQDVRRARRGAGPAARMDLDRARERLDEASSDLEAESDNQGDEVVEDTAGPGVPWRRVALLAVAVFVVAIAAISVFELLAGRSVSTITGGTDDDRRTSLTGIFGDRTGEQDKKRQRDEPTQQPATPATPSSSTSPEPTDQASDQASDQPSGSSSESGATDGTTGPAVPTETVTVTVGPSEPATPAAPGTP